MHTRSSRFAALAVVFVVSLFVIGQAALTQAIFLPDDAPPRNNSTSLQ